MKTRLIGILSVTRICCVVGICALSVSALPTLVYPARSQVAGEQNLFFFSWLLHSHGSEPFVGLSGALSGQYLPPWDAVLPG